MTIILDDMRINDFYHKNTHLDPTVMNLLIIDIYNKMLLNDQSFTNDILNNIKDYGIKIDDFKKEFHYKIDNTIETYKNELSLFKNNNKNTHSTLISEINIIKDTLLKLNNDITNNIVAKLFDIRKNNIDDLKMILDNNNTDNYNKISDKLEKENYNIISKISFVINDIIPKTQNIYYLQYDTIIKNFKDDITKNIDTFKNNNITIEQLNTIMDKKYNSLFTNVQDTLFNYFNTHTNNINNHFNILKENSSNQNIIQDKINDDLHTFLSKFKVGVGRGLVGETILFNILNVLFPSCEIINSTSLNNSGDFMLVRQNKKTILIETKDYSNVNVPKKEVLKFQRDVNEQNTNGIMFSNNSGIAIKNDFEIDVNNGNVLIYVHNLKYDSDKIKLAINIIDNLSDKLDEIKEKTNGVFLSQDTLKNLNQQYLLFINKRNNIINFTKEQNNKMIQFLNELEIPDLNLLVSSRFATTNVFNLNCKYCNCFTGTTMKGLKNHLRSHPEAIESDAISDEQEIITTQPVVIDDTTIKIKSKTKSKTKTKKI